MTAAPPILQRLRSSTAGARPGDGTHRWLLPGEEFINTADGAFFYTAANGALRTVIFPNLLDTVSSQTVLAPKVFAGGAQAPTVATTDNGTNVATTALLRTQLGFLTLEMYNATAGSGGDDSAALVAALSDAGTGPVKTIVLIKTAYQIAQSTQIVVPANVVIRGWNVFAGADGANLSQLNFTSATGGLFTNAGACLHGLRLSGLTSATVPLVEMGGQTGIYNVRTENTPIGAQVTRKLSANSSLDLGVGASSGLTNGTYTGVAFTGSGTTNARVTVTVASGAITAIALTAYDTMTLPSLVIGFAAGALYSGSPAVASAAFLITCTFGRSRFSELWMVNHTTQALEIDCAYDFCNAFNVHVWNPGAACAKALRVGKCDGLTLTGFKSFNATIGQSWENPYPSISFATAEGTELDLMNLGIQITGPMQIDFKGGYVRSVGNCFIINAPLSIVGINMNLLANSAHSIIGNGWASITIAGCNFTRAAYLPGAWNIALQSTAGGTCLLTVGDNNTDGNSGFMFLSGPVQARIGTNNWWPITAGDTYVNYGSVSDVTKLAIDPVRMEQATFTTNSSGQITIPHGIGYTPFAPSVDVIGAAGAAGYWGAITSVGNTNIVCQIFAAGGAVAASGLSIQVLWKA